LTHGVYIVKLFPPSEGLSFYYFQPQPAQQNSNCHCDFDQNRRLLENNVR